MKRFLLMLAGLAALTVYMVPDAHAGNPLPRDVGPNNHAGYEKECGSCHFAYQAGWLPDRSWRALMGSLDKHFGESIRLDAAKHAEILKHLLDGSADRMQSLRSVQVLASLRGEPTPLAVSRVPLVSGIHGGFLDPAYNPNPAPKSLANCTTCHAKAASGTFKHVQFTVSDESFRGKESSIGVGLSAAEREVLQGK